ncbi:hypothetical protein ACHAQA_007186 [Verticillium albo-atrum]
MSGFTIPGLGFAKPNETLPPLSPDTAAAAAAAANAEATAPVSEQAGTSTEKQAPATHLEPTTASIPAPDTDADAMNIDNPASPPSLTSALEAALGTAEPIQTDQEITSQAAAALTEANAAADGALLEATLQRPQQPGEAAHPEWEEDSSPYESSSDSSSSDSSSDDDDDDDKEPYELLGVEETARMLMEAGSDDEGDASKSGTSAGIRSKNERPLEPVPKPEVTITADMKVEELGVVSQIVDTILVIRGFTPGEYQVLDTGSVLCTEDRAVFGAVAETIGKVLQPMYTVMFSSPEDIAAAGLVTGAKVCYPVAHAKYVFTRPLRNVKGSDASNIHDEEIAEDEMEFSDDEKEAEHKKQKKQAKRDGRGGGRGGGAGRGGGGGREPHPLRNEVKTDTTMGGLNYDDEDDGPYKPLARPASFGQGPPIQQGFTQEPEPGSRQAGRGGRGDFRGRGRGRGDRGRGDRGRGRGRGGSQHRGDSRDGFAQAPQGQRPPQQQQQQQQQPSQPQGQWNAGGYQAPAQAQVQPQAYAQQPAAAAPAHPFSFPGMPAPPPAQGGFPAAPPPPPGWPGAQQGAQGAQAQFNPAFFAAMLAQMQRSQGQNGQQPPPPPPQ